MLGRLGPLAKKKKILSGDAVLSFGVATGTDHRRNRTPFVAGVTALLLFLAHIVKAADYGRSNSCDGHVQALKNLTLIESCGVDICIACRIHYTFIS